jgi:gamma-glutamyl-gamma-aminobutyrate hydrolase PuuD
MTNAGKLIAVSQRVDSTNTHGERRDALDQQWGPFLKACGYTVAPVPNIGADISAWLNGIAPAGIVLSGGNDLAALGGDAPERDATEDALIAWATQRRVPLIGVCRGMQLLAHRTGCVIERVSGHVATEHPITGAFGPRTVNSYHSWGVTKVSDQWHTLATAPDNTIEAFRHVAHAHMGVMWHPERGAAPRAEDIQIFQQHFGKVS